MFSESGLEPSFRLKAEMSPCQRPFRKGASLHCREIGSDCDDEGGLVP